MTTKGVSKKSNEIEGVLVENFVALQEVMANLSENFTKLSMQISKLLGLFETSAKTIAEKGIEDNKEIIKKLDELSNQNKILAQGLALLHEYSEEQAIKPQEPPRQLPKAMPSQKPVLQIPTSQPPQQMYPPPQMAPQTQQNTETYQKSISTVKEEM